MLKVVLGAVSLGPCPEGKRRARGTPPCRVVQHQPPTTRSTMTLDRCHLVLSRLRDFVASTQALDLSNHPPSGALLADLVDDLIRLADSFVHELRAAGCSRELEELARRFCQLTGPGSELDRARDAAFRAAYFPQGRPPSFSNMAGKSLPGEVPLTTEIDGRLVYNKIFTMGKTTARELHSLRRFREGLQSAEHLRFRIRRLSVFSSDAVKWANLAAAIREELMRFRSALVEVQVEADRCHLFGCFLLEACRTCRTEMLQAVNPDTPFVWDDWDFPFYMVQILEAGEYLLAAAAGGATEPGRDGGEATSGSEEKEPPGSSGAPFPEDPPKPELGMLLSQLRGHRKEIAAAICPVYEREVDIRTLTKLHKRGELYIQRIEPQTLKVYFREQSMLSECNAAWLRLQDIRKLQPKRRRKKQEETN